MQRSIRRSPTTHPALRAPFSRNLSQRTDDFRLINVIRIIRPAVPGERMLPHSLFFAQHVFQEFKIAGRPAAILRRAAPLSTEKLRMRHVRQRRTDLLYDDRVLPIIAHVLRAAEASNARLNKRRQRHEPRTFVPLVTYAMLATY